jgi:hypothetical protein
MTDALLLKEEGLDSGIGPAVPQIANYLALVGDSSD